MDVKLKLKDWRIKKGDKDDPSPKISGEYEVVMGDKIIATQSFNAGGYSSDKKLPFTGDLIKEVITLEDKIAKEIEEVI